MPRLSRLVREREKEGLLFEFYHVLGVGRSLKRVHEMALAGGGTLSLKTIERYSAKYDWQRRLLERQSADAEAFNRVASDAVDQMNRRASAVGAAMVVMSSRGLQAITDRAQRIQRLRQARGEADAPLTIDLTASEIATLARAGNQLERLALGEATSRTEVWVDVARTVVREFVLIFRAINTLEDESERVDAFLRQADEMVARYYGETTKRQLLNEGDNGPR